MSVFIKGMDKPTDCFRCQLRTGKYCGVLTENEQCVDNGILPHCPITEVKIPHGRLIDENQVETVYGKSMTTHYQGYISRTEQITHTDAPTVIEAEVE